MAVSGDCARMTWRRALAVMIAALTGALLSVPLATAGDTPAPASRSGTVNPGGPAAGAAGPHPQGAPVTAPKGATSGDPQPGGDKQPGAARPIADPAASPAVILAHGEFTDGSIWRKVLPLLREAGVRARAVQLPLNSMWADVAVIQRALEQEKGPVVLVGHSWGGVVITEAGVDPRVAALVYVAAPAPDAGESFRDRVRHEPRGPGLMHLRTDASGFVSLAEDAFSADFAQDLKDGEVMLLAETQAPVFGQAFVERVNNAAWKTLPAWYVLASADRMIDPAVQEAEAARIKARLRRVEASHAIVLSQPEAVAGAILEAVAAVRDGAGDRREGGPPPAPEPKAMPESRKTPQPDHPPQDPDGGEAG